MVSEVSKCRQIQISVEQLYQHLSLAAIEGDYQKAVRNLEI